MRSFDAIVVGGGMLGPAIALGLVEEGLSTAILDEGDRGLRAARGNFGLVWFQGKGLGMSRYVRWTYESTQLWPAFAAALAERTGVDTGYRKTGGLDLCLGEEGLAARRWHIGQLRQQQGEAGYDCEFLDRQQAAELIPATPLGADVLGASFSPHDGHANPLLLMRAMHAAVVAGGGTLLPGHRVEDVRPVDGAFHVITANGSFAAAKVVLAAGHGSSALAPRLGLYLPIRPQRGQILVTERLRPLLGHAMSRVRQTREGAVMLGDSQEDVGFDDRTTGDVTARIAREAVRALPALARVRMVRTWAALRILTPDKHPVYTESQAFPGAYAAATHSGVTLAAVHRARLAPWIAHGAAPADFDAFSPERFRAAPQAA